MEGAIATGTLVRPSSAPGYTFGFYVDNCSILKPDVAHRLRKPPPPDFFAKIVIKIV